MKTDYIVMALVIGAVFVLAAIIEPKADCSGCGPGRPEAVGWVRASECVPLPLSRDEE